MYNYLLPNSCRITTHQPHANGACDETQLGGDDGGAADRDRSHALCLRTELVARHCPIRPWHSRARAWPALWLSRSCRLAIEPSALPAGGPGGDAFLGLTSEEPALLKARGLAVVVRKSARLGRTGTRTPSK